MDKRKSFCLFMVVVLVCSPFLSLFFQSVKADNTNLMSVTDGKWYDDMHWVNAPCPQYGEIVSTTNTYGGSDSWQCTLSPNGWGVDWLGGSLAEVVPNDVVYFSFWIETSAATNSADVGNDIAGGRIGFDVYGSTGDIGSPDWGSAAFVPFGNNWTEVVLNWTVPATLTQQSGYSSVSTAAVGSQVVPTFIIPWVQVFSCTVGLSEGGTAWFADPTLSINPSGSSVSTSPPPTSSTSNIVATNIALEPTYTSHQQSYVESGFVLPINVTVQNIGSVSEVASVELFANSTLIFNGALSVDGSASGVLNCLVSTESLPIGNYTIDASVTAIGEPNVTPNTISAGTIGVTYVGDLTGDFKVDSSSFFAYISNYIAYWTTGYVNPAADFNHDGKIDFSDTQIFLDAYINSAKQET